MASTRKNRQSRKISACGIATILLSGSLALAKSYDIAVDTISLAATALEKAAPLFPDSEDLRKGQEGWVRLNFVVTPDGAAVEPIVVDSVGGEAFEKAALDAVGQWRFESSEAEIANNSVAFRFEHSDDSGRASRNFMRWYRLILTELANEDVDKARENLDRTKAFGGWNLYESTILSIVEGRVAESEGNSTLSRAAYRRALGINDSAALTAKTKRELLTSLVRLETEQQRFVSAQEALEALRETRGFAKALASLTEEIEQLEAASEHPTAINVAGNIAAPCECESGQAVWAHRPSRRHFTIENIDGNVERLEARCDNDRLIATVDLEAAWTLPADWGDCEVFVFGDEGAKFAFIESSETSQYPAPDEGAIAASSVLD